MKKLIAILILISTILLSTLIIHNSHRYKMVNIFYGYEIVDDHIENDSKQPFGG